MSELTVVEVIWVRVTRMIMFAPGNVDVLVFEQLLTSALLKRINLYFFDAGDVLRMYGDRWIARKMQAANARLYNDFESRTT